MDGRYPSDEELEKIRHWPIGRWRELAEFVVSIWEYGEPWGRLIAKNDGSYVLRLATGGWSGNESIVSALKDNMFSMACWHLSKRGGLHIYKIRKSMAEAEPSEAGKDGCIRNRNVA